MALLSVDVSIIQSEFNCPITMEPMREPVLAKCSHSFEKSAIEKWLEKETTCPVCRKNIDKVDLVANRALQQIIQLHLKPNKEENTYINIHMQTGHVVQLHILFTETIATLKKELRKKGEISPDWWVLIYDGHKLENDKTLADYNIQQSSLLEQIKPMQIFLKTFFTEAGHSIIMTLDLLPSDTLDDLREEFAKSCMRHKRFRTKKEALAYIANFHVDSTLGLRRIAENWRTLKNYNITNESTLSLTEILPKRSCSTCSDGKK